MNPEPLDFDKIEEEIINELNRLQPHDLQTELDIFKKIIKQHLKSAILGLKKDLKNEVVEMKKHSPDDVFNDGFETAIFRCIELVGKWFKDVL